MNWKLIFQLSLFGLAMGVATVYFIPSKIEPAFWLVIFLYCAYVIAKCSGGRHFLHGLLLGLANSVWITLAHVLLFDRYVAGHAQEAAMMQNPSLPLEPRAMMAVVGPVVGLISGVVLGLFALAAGKLVKSSPAPERMRRRDHFASDLVAHVVQNGDRYRSGQAINPEQIPAIAFEPFAEPLQRERSRDKRADHSNQARHHG
jgi:hypothetical protein